MGGLGMDSLSLGGGAMGAMGAMGGMGGMGGMGSMGMDSLSLSGGGMGGMGGMGGGCAQPLSSFGASFSQPASTSSMPSTLSSGSSFTMPLPAPSSSATTSVGASSSPSTAASLTSLMAGLNGGISGPAPRAVVLEALRLAADPQSHQRGASWAASWADGPTLSPAEFTAICQTLERMFASGRPAAAGGLGLEGLSLSTSEPLSPPRNVPSSTGDPWGTPPPPAGAQTPPPPPPPPEGHTGVFPSPSHAQQQQFSSFSKEHAVGGPAELPYSAEEAEQYSKLFMSMGGGAKASRQQVSSTMSRANLPQGEVDVIWALCDLDADGFLDEEEVVLALHLAAYRFKGNDLPDSLPHAWLSAAKRQMIGAPADADASSAAGGGDDGELQEKRKKGGLFSRRRSSVKATSKGASKAEALSGASSDPPASFGSHGGGGGGGGGSGGAGFGDGFGDGFGGGFGDGFGGGGGGGDGFGGSSFGSLDPAQKIHVRIPGAPSPQKPSTDGGSHGGPLVEPNSVSRSGALTMTTDKKKTRWVVLGAAQLAIYSDKKDATGAKPPKVTVDVRRDVGRVVCNSMQSFSILLSADVVDGKKAKDKKVAYKAGESLAFSSDDSKELTAWVNDLTNVWKACQAGR
jgi:hypothetical protein